MSFMSTLSRVIRRPVVSRGNARRRSGRSLWRRPCLERLEDRLPPGDWLLAALFGPAWLGASLAEANLAAGVAEPAGTGALSAGRAVRPSTWSAAGDGGGTASAPRLCACNTRSSRARFGRARTQARSRRRAVPPRREQPGRAPTTSGPWPRPSAPRAGPPTVGAGRKRQGAPPDSVVLRRPPQATAGEWPRGPLPSGRGRQAPCCPLERAVAAAP